jgi:hypothetical protein
MGNLLPHNRFRNSDSLPVLPPGHEWKGKCLNKIPTGRGIYKTSEYIIYGNYENGVVKGNCRVEYTNGKTYFGEWSNGSANGNGEMVSRENNYHNFHIYGLRNSNEKYRGEYRGVWLNGQKTGFGEGKWINHYYKGEWLNGQPHGEGYIEYYIPHCTYALQEVWYKGGWINDQRSGYGELKYSGTFSFYKGHWKNDKKNGQGHLMIDKIVDYSEYIGEFLDDKYHGTGTKNTGSYIYKGTWSNSEFNGKGTYIYLDDNIYCSDNIVVDSDSGARIIYYPSSIRGTWINGQRGDGWIQYKFGFVHTKTKVVRIVKIDSDSKEKSYSDMSFNDFIESIKSK